MPTDTRAAAKQAAVEPGVILLGLGHFLTGPAKPKARDAQLNQVQIEAELSPVHVMLPYFGLWPVRRVAGSCWRFSGRGCGGGVVGVWRGYGVVPMWIQLRPSLAALKSSALCHRDTVEAVV